MDDTVARSEPDSWLLLLLLILAFVVGGVILLVWQYFMQSLFFSLINGYLLI